MVKRLNLIVFACILALFCLSSCDENQQVIGILKDATELDWLDVIAYAGEYVMPGGSALDPSLRADVFDYTAYVDKDTTHFVIDAGIDGNGTIVVYNDQVTGDTTTHFDLLGDEVVVTVKATREYMEMTEYRVTVIRGEPVPTAKDVEISVVPGVASFFIGSGIIPEIKVTAIPPGVDTVMNYQWYVNDQNNTRTGNPITNANGDSYTMQAGETMTERTIYYYVDITTIVDGKTGITQSAPCRVTFINKGNLTEKSVEMADIPAGTVTNASNEWTFSSVFAQAPWSTPGIRMGSHLVTYELWETVRERAEAAKYYSFAQNGNQGAASGYGLNTNQIPQHIGNKLNPVTSIGWRTAVVWCNAYSEMDGKQPVYRGFDGEPLRDSRDGVEALIDESNMNWNGYRLPTFEEWLFAARGAVPSGDHRTDKYTGTDSNDFNEIGKYLWSHSSGVTAEGVLQTGEVGSLHPLVLSNGSMLYDMMGMVYQFVWKPAYLKDQVYFMGSVFTVQYDTLNYSSAYVAPTFPHEVAMTNYVGFRVARNRGE